LGPAKNLPFYTPSKKVTGIDIKERMLKRAREKAARRQGAFILLKMDAQHLAFPDASFEVV